MQSAAQFAAQINKEFAKATTPVPPPVRISFLGIKGSFTDVAARKFFDDIGLPTSATGQPTIQSVFEAVSEGKVEAGVVPIESTWSGSFARCYDSLLKHPVSIVGEISVFETHCLCAVKGAKEGDITTVHSHPDMFAQCSAFLATLSKEKKIEKVPELDSASACVKALKNSTHGAICSPEAAKLHGMDILHSGVGNDSNIASRYIVFVKSQPTEQKASIPYAQEAEPNDVGQRIVAAARESSNAQTLNGGSQGGPTKCTVALTMHNEAQGLFKVLSCFALRGMNVTKLDSRPSSSALGTVLRNTVHWEYVFFLDFEPTNPKAINTVLSNVREFCSYVKVLGVYQANLKSVEVKPTPLFEKSVSPRRSNTSS
eukprot:CAMPEP_0114509182 /NCGR_PEP_ID=MMETSP0109-20121206/13058_1 /TAXON_ID=29199 /ORGANISM="Chlorarachnion reptans, Strain CCCM449" /LENGTH=370 /DNA_ID=CAMNT_0001688287 /DNA_START=62 /DNA_END=1174 /DNA_ORIENTATION=+